MTLVMNNILVLNASETEIKIEANFAVIHAVWSIIASILYFCKLSPFSTMSKLLLRLYSHHTGPRIDSVFVCP